MAMRVLKHNSNQYTLQRNTSTSNRRNMNHSNKSTAVLSTSSHGDHDVSYILLRRDDSTSSSTSPYNDVPCDQKHVSKTALAHNKLSSLFRSLMSFLSFPTILPSCKWLTIPSTISITPAIGRKVNGTLFGHRRGHVSFAVQLEPRSEPILLLELAMSTSSLVKEMSSGLVRIVLECEKPSLASIQATGGRRRKLSQEPTWTMSCNGKNSDYAVSRTCGDMDRHVLRTVQAVSVGAGVIPLVEHGIKGVSSAELGELLYMRARFERVVGSHDSEAFYMLNPDGNGGPELSIFLLRI